jgi:hypothetical protein
VTLSATRAFVEINSRAKRPPMLTGAFLAMALTALPVAVPLFSRQPQNPDPSLIAHEWGTFTSIADNAGQAVEWLPLTGSTDLPGFVEHFRNASFKRGLSGTVRMETPVLYFHAAHQTTVSVKVAFSRGLITEWYPHANRLEPNQRLTDVSLHEAQTDGSIAWDSVIISPDHGASFPREDGNNPYYAARETSASPLLVKTSAGGQREKFLFYRGVSVFPVPISATLTPGAAVQITDLLKQEIPNIILFERRGEKIGYRVFNSLQKETNLDPPELNSTIDSLASELRQMLAAQGLYQDEAHAMVETWRHSWFEEGSRLLYLVPRQFVDAVLPLDPPHACTNRARLCRAPGAGHSGNAKSRPTSLRLSRSRDAAEIRPLPGAHSQRHDCQRV